MGRELPIHGILRFLNGPDHLVNPRLQHLLRRIHAALRGNSQTNLRNAHRAETEHSPQRRARASFPAIDNGLLPIRIRRHNPRAHRRRLSGTHESDRLDDLCSALPALQLLRGSLQYLGRRLSVQDGRFGLLRRVCHPPVFWDGCFYWRLVDWPSAEVGS
jgi:hypothetical protein